MAQVAAHARSYTPEWRYEGAEDDPGSALAELFGTSSIRRWTG